MLPQRSDATLYDPLGSLPTQARDLLSQIGPVWGRAIHRHRDMVIEAYTPLAARGDKTGVRIVRDAPYGPHGRHVVDIFYSVNVGSHPVLLYLHGGAFIRGAKRTNSELYDNLCYWFARQGMVVVNVEYRLAPEAPYPGGSADLALAVEWCRENIGRYGGDPDRVLLMGHSAGASHVATYLVDPVMKHPPSAGVRGAILLSGRLRADAREDNPNAAGVRAYYGDDPSLYAERSPVTHVERAQVPIFIAVAEFENPWLDVYGAEFAYRLGAVRGRLADFVRMSGHNHISMVAHFNTGEEFLGRRIARFCSSAAL